MIVSQLNPRDNITDRFPSRGVHHPVGSLILQGSVKRLRPGIVTAHPRTLHERADTIGIQVVQELLGRVQTSPVRGKTVTSFSTGHLRTAISMT